MLQSNARPTSRILLLGLLVLLVGRGAIAQPVEVTLDRDDQLFTESVRVRPGTYRIADSNGDGVVHVRRDEIVLDFQGATLIGAPAATRADAYRGVGISIRGARKVVIKNAIIRGFKVAIQAVDCEKLEVQGCDTSGNFRQYLSSTPKAEASGDWLWPHVNDAGEWEKRYGAGISLTKCRDSAVHGNRGRDGQNGILLTRCDGCKVYDNDFSFNSGWGLALYRSSKNVVSRNKFDWCVRGYSHGVYARGQDSTGILVFEQSNGNVFAYNSATHGGDGFFLYAGHETTKKTGVGGCNDNLVFRNDFSYAVANGIEATFSERNRFLDNRIIGCNYGVWAGYSSDTLIAGNLIKDSYIAGVAIEHGQLNKVIGNSFVYNPIAVKLWWDEDPQFVKGTFGKRRNTNSEDYTIESNRFFGDAVVLELRDTKRIGFSNNTTMGCPTVVDLHGESPGVVVQENNVTFRPFKGMKAPANPDGKFHIVRNRSSIKQIVGPNKYDVPLKTLRPMVEGHVEIADGLDKLATKPPPQNRNMPRVPGETKQPFLTPGVPQGRENIFVDEWGPFDPRLVRLTPTTFATPNEAIAYLIGRKVPFKVTSVTGDVTVTPTAGKVPATLSIKRKNDAKPASFAVVIEAEGKSLRCAGMLGAAKSK